MKIVRSTDETLILAHTPWLLGLGVIACSVLFAAAGLLRMLQNPEQGLLAVAASLAAGLLLFALVWRRTELILDRSEGTVTLRKRRLLGVAQDIFPLSDLAHAATQLARGRGTPKVAMRVALVFGHGAQTRTHPVTWLYQRGPAPVRAVNAINAWLGV